MIQNYITYVNPPSSTRCGWVCYNIKWAWSCVLSWQTLVSNTLNWPLMTL